MRGGLYSVVLILSAALPAFAQQDGRPSLRTGSQSTKIIIDGQRS